MLDAVADQAFKLWGLHGTALLVTLVVISMICQLVARLIPEDATGWKGVIRRVAKVIGLYASNRITSGVSINDVAKATIQTGVVSARDLNPEELPQADWETDHTPGTQLEEPLELTNRVVIPAFPGLQRPRDSEGNFLPLSDKEG